MAAGPITLTDPGQWLKSQTAQPAALSDPGEWLANQSQPQTTREHLKSEGILDSVWNAIKGGPELVLSLVNGDYAKSHQAEDAQIKHLDANGTEDQRREYAKDYLLRHIPGASTVYKAAQGNLPGAAGDLAGVLALGGLLKGAGKATEVAGKVTDYLQDVPEGAIPEALKAGTKAAVLNAPVLGRPLRAGLRAASKSMEASREAAAVPEAAAPAEAPAAESAAEILAGGKAEFEKLSKGDQAILQHVADAQERMKASGQPAPTPRPAAPPSPVPTSVSPEPSKSIADVLREELAAQRGSVPASGSPPVTAAVPESAGLRGPVRPPLAAQPSPALIPPKPAPQPVSAPATGNVGDLARQLFDAMQESGTIPKEAVPGEPIAAQPAVSVDKAAYEGGARSVRADRAGSLAQAAHAGATEAGIDPQALANLSTDQWQQIAQRSDIDFPKTKEAQSKLIRDTLVEVMKLSDKPQTIGGLMNPK